ncbi:CheF family chemotaxis protein [Halovenus marina]|uniref:CheF family chemotaxis protein n=1 Tax=Halovenus marina TaxID=3396621 RepID=UPI003F547B3E
MSEGETKLADQRGKFTQVVKGGRKVPEIEWIAGRILLSTKRLILASNEGKRTIQLGKIGNIKSRQNAPQPNVSSYLSIQVGNDVTLVSPQNHDDFEQRLYDAVLDQSVVLVKHPAVEGGVVQGTDWEKGRITVDENEVALALTSGQFVEIDIDDVGTLEQKDGEVRGDMRLITEVGHTVEGTAVQTHVTGPRQTVSVLASLLRKGEQQNAADVDLTDEQNEVLMALYSGVSPFQIPKFVGMDVERVERIYDDLIEAGVLEKKRTRREVELKARGRHIASEATADE